MMLPSTGDLWIYDFTMVNGGGGLKVSKARGWLSTSKARSQALVRQPARAKPNKNKKAGVPPAAGQARNSVGQG